MLVPYNVDVPMERWPYANWGLIAFTTVISLAVLAGVGQGSDRRAREEQRLWEELTRKDAKPEEVARALKALDAAAEPAPPLALVPGHWTILQLFTSLFVHGDLLHLIGNMLFLFVFGNAVNAKLGHVPFVGIYLLIGALEGIAWLLIGDGRPVIGASGAIMGIVGIFLVLYPRNDVNVFYWFLWVGAGAFSISSMWLILFYVGGDLFGTIFDGNGGIAYIAHLAGMVTGTALAVTGVIVGWLEPSRGEQNLLQLLGFHGADRAKPRERSKAATRR